MEIITLITGVIYIILEIRQKNAMWVLGIFTSIAAIIVFFRQGLYASFGLNIYYLITSFIEETGRGALNPSQQAHKKDRHNKRHRCHHRHHRPFIRNGSYGRAWIQGKSDVRP